MIMCPNRRGGALTQEQRVRLVNQFVSHHRMLQQALDGMGPGRDQDLVIEAMAVTERVAEKLSGFPGITRRGRNDPSGRGYG